MKATEANLLKFLKKSPQFVIPIYQRNYSWLPDVCRQLWADLLRAGRNDGVAAHFISSIVYVERALSTVTSQEAMLVIDGQQRLTTSSLPGASRASRSPWSPQPAGQNRAAGLRLGAQARRCARRQKCTCGRLSPEPSTTRFARFVSRWRNSSA
jgi:hypothetical protein